MSSPIVDLTTGGSSGEHHVDLKPIDNSAAEDALRVAETACQLALQQIPQEVEVSQELLVYPEGEVGAVTITKRDEEGLQPGGDLSNNVVDFYIRFLERGLSPEHGNRFYFFNSFFFTKLLQSIASTGIDPCKVDYAQLQKWTEGVNLFAKDYVFIPILKSSHWSLVIICHLSNLTCSPGEMMRSPCVVHLDPIRGQHESFEGLIRSYVLQAWMERFQVSSNGDQLLALCQMKYVEAKVLEQGNSHDCGLHVLNYIEAFLVKSTLSNFSFPSSDKGLYFNGPHFVLEVLGKRKLIQDLILKLRSKSQKRAKKRRAIEELLQSIENLRLLLFHEGNLEACIKDVQLASFFNGQGSKIYLVSTHEDALNPQDKQSSGISRGDDESLNDAQIELAKYEDGSETLSPKQQYVEPKGQIGGPMHFNGSIFVAKHASSHVDAFDVQHQQSSRISRLDGLEIQHVDNQRVNEGNMLQHLVFEEVPCLDMVGVQKRKNKRGRNMTKEETWVLLTCMVEGGRFCKGSGGRTHWNLICEEIGNKLGSLVSANQCRLRYDTLLKAYKTYKKYCMKIGKVFSTITEAERLELKLATSLSEEMYTTMDEIHEMHSNPNISQKRLKLSSNVCNDLHLLNSLVPNPLPISRGRSFEDKVVMDVVQVVLDSACGAMDVALRNVIPLNVLSSLNEDLQFTLLNLVQECSLRGWFRKLKNGKIFYLRSICRSLAILQDHEPREILNYVLQLWKLDFVNVEGMVFEEVNEIGDVDLWADKTWFLKLEFYEKILKEVLCKNPQFQTYCNSYPFEESLGQYIRVLILNECYELEHLDLKVFPSLRSLGLWDCLSLNLVTGWEVPTGLASLEIRDCDAYLDFPEVQYLLSLREIVVSGRRSNMRGIPRDLSQFSQCSKLQRLDIRYDESLSEVADLEMLKELKFLESLTLDDCSFSSIRGLSGLQALTTLEFIGCQNLKKVLDLGCLKGLTHLSMRWSGVNNIQGVEKLHLLISLKLLGCRSLEWIPFLGHLKGLVYLDIRETSVKEILGREDLINLKILEGNVEWRVM